MALLSGQANFHTWIHSQIFIFVGFQELDKPTVNLSNNNLSLLFFFVSHCLFNFFLLSQQIISKAFKNLCDSRTFYITYPAGRVAISNKILFHSLRLNCQIRAVPSRLPLTNLTKGEKGYLEIKSRSVQKRHLKITVPEFRIQKQKIRARSPNRMLYKWFEVKKHFQHQQKNWRPPKSQSPEPFPS